MEPATYPLTGELETPDAKPSRSMIWKSLMVLFKIRVVILLLFAAVAGAFLASAGWPGAGTLAVLLLAGGSAAAGASAINQYLERDLDERMERTSRRPLAARYVAQPRRVLWAGTVMILLPSLLVLPFNPELSVFRWYVAASEAGFGDGGLAENPELSAFSRYAAATDDGDRGLAENPELSTFLWFQAEQEAEFPPLLCSIDC